jgi:hypothetical protein
VELSDMKPLSDKRATLRLSNGEIATVKVIFVDEEYEDIIVEVLKTSHPDQYRDSSAAYTFAAKDIVSAEVSE